MRRNSMEKMTLKKKKDTKISLTLKEMMNALKMKKIEKERKRKRKRKETKKKKRKKQKEKEKGRKGRKKNRR